jgi:hypothetical protein
VGSYAQGNPLGNLKVASHAQNNPLGKFKSGRAALAVGGMAGEVPHDIVLIVAGRATDGVGGRNELDTNSVRPGS